MRCVFAVAAATVVGGCHSDSSTCKHAHAVRPGGEVLRGVSAAEGGIPAMLSDGTLVVMYDQCGAFELAPGATQPAPMNLPGLDGMFSMGLVSGPDADPYYITSDGFFHTTEAGDVIWQMPFDWSAYLVGTNPEGAYVASESTDFGYHYTTVYAPADGAVVWQQQGWYYPDGIGGTFQLLDEPGTFAPVWRVTAHDASLAPRWTKTVTASSTTTTPPDLHMSTPGTWSAAPIIPINALAPVTGNAVILTGRLFGTHVDLGDAALSTNDGMFLAVLDYATGATRWTYAWQAYGEVSVSSVGDLILLAGVDAQTPTGSITLITLDPTGQASRRELAVSSRTSPKFFGASVWSGADGTIWLDAENFQDHATSLELDVDSQHFAANDPVYYLNLVL